jgi:hypothetical protein
MKPASKTGARQKQASLHSVAQNCPKYHLKITLDVVKPAIWRQLAVPGNANLGWLHAAIQVTMGWTNSHLHMFLVGGRQFSDPAVMTTDFGGGPKVMDENKFLLLDVAPCEKDVLHYEYDFGDTWLHTILVEKIQRSEPDGATTAECLAGKGACPPEDCGGPCGYQDLLKILRNPRHAEHNSMKEWIGRPFDSEAFDPVSTNLHLQRVKWPRTSEAQLRRVLVKRDNYVG